MIPTGPLPPSRTAKNTTFPLPKTPSWPTVLRYVPIALTTALTTTTPKPPIPVSSSYTDRTTPIISYHQTQPGNLPPLLHPVHPCYTRESNLVSPCQTTNLKNHSIIRNEIPQLFNHPSPVLAFMQSYHQRIKAKVRTSMYSSRKMKRSSGPYFAPSQTGCRWRLWQGEVGKAEGEEWAGGLGGFCFQLLDEIGRCLVSNIRTGWGKYCIMLA